MLSAKCSVPLRFGDVVRVQTPGAAGWGQPLERDPAGVVADVRAEKLSVQYARRVYGVVIDETTLELNEGATARLRRRRTQPVPTASPKKARPGPPAGV
ncbi:MAG: hypothetical protein HY329_02250 [Chloroflexi bacterium]|nr:hypothetical protein [Chloroflexota bacterium]